MLRKLATRTLRFFERVFSLEWPAFQSSTKLQGPSAQGAEMVEAAESSEAIERLEEAIDLDALGVELSLDHQLNLFQQAINDPLSFLREHGERLPKSPTSLRPDEPTPHPSSGQIGAERVRRSAREPEASGIKELPPSPSLVSARPSARPSEPPLSAPLTAEPPRPPASIPKIKLRRDKSSKKKAPKGLQRSTRAGDSLKLSPESAHQWTQRSGDVTERSYQARRSREARAPSRYEGAAVSDDYAASARASILQNIVESLDELIIMHKESLARREAFFESVRDLIDGRQLVYTEADAWWFHLNRVIAPLEELRVLSQRAPSFELQEAERSAHAGRYTAPSRSSRRQASRVKQRSNAANPLSLHEGLVEIRFNDLPLEVAQEVNGDLTSTTPAQAKPHQHKGSARLFRSSLPQHDLAALSLDPAESVSLDQRERQTQAPQARPLK